tara:strand:- start:1213 stop:2022 length:810 start_codon:yes stop_codon:yes gene_type:complete
MNINGTEYTIGADPEIFVKDGGGFVSAHDLVQGTKENPYPVDKGAVQVDGMALEFNIDPASSPEEFEDNINTVMAQLGSMIGDLEFLKESSVTFDKEFLVGVPRENLALGCEPDYNAYTQQPNPPPSEGELMRTTGGHVHVGGFTTGDIRCAIHNYSAGMLAKALDETLGIYSLFWDNDDKRREMYGQAGAYRPKTYGMEYRTLSNKWIFRPELIRFVYDAVAEALTNLHDPNYEGVEDAQDIINTSNRNHPIFENNPKVAFLKNLVGA